VKKFIRGGSVHYVQQGGVLKLVGPAVQDHWKAVWKSPHPLVFKPACIKVVFDWKDQGWGNRKGMLRLELIREGTAPAVILTPEVSPHGWESIIMTIIDSDDNGLLRQCEAGDYIQIQRLIGSGGGHELHLRNFCITFLDESGKDGRDTDSLCDVNSERRQQIACEVEAAFQIGEKRWNRSKVMLLGERRAGKTCLTRALMNQTFAHTNSTRGAELFTVEVSDAGVCEGRWTKSTHATQNHLATAVAQLIKCAATKSTGTTDMNHAVAASIFEAPGGSSEHIRSSESLAVCSNVSDVTKYSRIYLNFPRASSFLVVYVLSELTTISLQVNWPTISVLQDWW
jgi:hypothetical protein